MKRRNMLTTSMTIVLAGMVVAIPGCSEADVAAAIKKNKPLILQTVQIASSRGSQEGLKAWAKKKPEAAKEAADALAKNLDDILAYLNGGTLGSSEAVDTFINSSLFNNVPDEVKTAVLAASAVLDLYLPVPSADTALNQDQLDYIKAFVTGLKQGVTAFNSKDLKKTWLR
jgi:hypothetical protein